MNASFQSAVAFLLGLFLIAPFSWVVGYDLMVFWSIFGLGVCAGGNAMLKELPRVWDYCRYSTICRWSVGVIVWSILAFVMYPAYALATGLPFDIVRAFVSLVSAMILA